MKVIFIDNLHHEHFTFFSEEDVIFSFKFLAKQKPHYIHIYASEVICIFELYLKKKKEKKKKKKRKRKNKTII